MARPHTDSDTSITEADLLDQHNPAVSEPVDAGEDPTGPTGALDANEADLVEQASVLPEDEDGYPNAYDDRSWEVWPDA